MTIPPAIANIVERAAWTAVQTFCAVFVATDLSSARSAGAAALAAALSVVKNGAQTQLAR